MTCFGNRNNELKEEHTSHFVSPNIVKGGLLLVNIQNLLSWLAMGGRPRRENKKIGSQCICAYLRFMFVLPNCFQ